MTETESPLATTEYGIYNFSLKPERELLAIFGYAR